MCKWGTDELVKVKIPADLACSGKSYWKKMGIDKCIAPLVRVLQEGGIDMRGSCCGHENGVGDICLQDGRILLIVDYEKCKNKKEIIPKIIKHWHERIL